MLSGIVQLKPFDLKDALPIIGVGLGWCLNELSQLWRARREDRKAMGRALTDLLLLRHRLLAVPKAVDELSKRFPIPEQGQTVLGHILSSWIPIEALTKRFEDAVTLVSGIDPVLGFRLRSQDLLATLTAQLRVAALNDPKSVCAWPEFERWLLEQIVPDLDRMVLDVARGHGWLTWFKTNRRLKRGLEFPLGALDGLTSTLQAQIRRAAEKPRKEDASAAQTSDERGKGAME